MFTDGTTVFITGATGLIGGELVRRLTSCGVGRIFCLIRPKPDQTPSQRLAARLARSDGGATPTTRTVLEAVAGDVTSPRFGMNRQDFARVAASTNLIIHCASELSFIRDASCRETNIAGMQNLIDLTRACRPESRLVHISTATVCGTVSHRCVSEADCVDSTNGHHNEYTRSKLVAEEVLRASGLPALVVRPSIVLSADLPAENFAKAILWFLPLLAEFDAMPVDPDSRVDVVPVSFVVDSMIELLRRPKLAHDCYHISAGRAGSMRTGDISASVDAFYGRSGSLKLIAPDQWSRQMHRQYIHSPRQRKLFATLKYYLPFLNMNVVYDNTRLRQELGRDAINIPPVVDYIGGILRLISPELTDSDGQISMERVAAVHAT